MQPVLEIKDLHVTVDDKEILKGVNLAIPTGEIHVIMGPNGSGKSTLSAAIMGHPKYKITSGDILFEGQSILNDSTDERARKGVFLCFQYPAAIPGVTINNFLRTALKNVRGEEIPVRKFRTELREKMDLLHMDHGFARRHVNDGFSGGEKKRNEILQMSLLQPKMAILDEIDSGLDIDALRIIAESLEKLRDPAKSMLIITHYQRILTHLTIEQVHVLMDGRIIRSGAKELVDKLEESGYDWIKTPQ